MAERLRLRHQQEIKDKIQTSQLINRLNKHIDGEIELSSSQVDAIKFLVNKTLSNAPTEIDQNITGELEINHELVSGAKDLLLQRIKANEPDRES